MKLFEDERKLYIILAAIFILTYVLTLGTYPLLDPDETRYVTMARDMFNSRVFLTLYINGEYFFEKPPLYFWVENLFFFIFGGKINEFTARLPLVILSILPLCLLFKLSEKVKDKKFAFLNCAILMTSLEYVLITKLAILDSVLTSLVSSSVLCYFFTFFVEQKNKKYFWLATYIFSALAVLAKGIPGAVIPAIVVFVGTITFKTYKETFKNLPLGLIVFLLIALPWHIVMLNKYNPLFFNEYIVKHHLARFLGSDTIHRNEPVWFYAVCLIWGLFPWIFSLIFSIRKPQKISLKTDYDKFAVLNLIALCSIFLFFTSSETKLVTYILPIYPFFATIIGHIWYKYIFENTESKAIKNSTVLINILFAIILLMAPFIGLFLPAEIYSILKTTQIVVIIIIAAYLTFSFIALKQDNRFNQFLTIAFFAAVLSGTASPLGFNIDYAFGQKDLIDFGKYAKENGQDKITAFETGRRYSLNYYSGVKVINFYFKSNEDDIEKFKKEFNEGNRLVIIKNKAADAIPFEFKTKIKDKKYSVIEK